MKRISLSLIIFLCSTFFSMGIAAAIPIPGVFSTGVNDSGSLLPLQTDDPHYSLVSSPLSTTPQAYSTDRHPKWAQATSTSQWITPSVYASSSGSPMTAAAGPYEYQTEFNLNGLDYNTAAISGSWASDNEAEIFLNGETTKLTNSGFRQLEDFSVVSGFQPGENTLAFKVQNFAGDSRNPTGLQVNITGSDAAPVPEPATIFLAAFGLVSLAGFGRKGLKRN